MNIIIHPDASYKVGLGHLKRCISIGQELKELSCEVKFFMKAEQEFSNIVKRSGFSVIDTSDQPLQCDMFIVDRYSIEEYALGIYKKLARKLVRIDDAAPEIMLDRISDVIINGNPYASQKMYAGHVRPGCKLILGTKYVPMNRSFRDARTIYKIRRDVKVITIAFGASEIGNKIANQVLKQVLLCATIQGSVIILTPFDSEKMKHDILKFEKLIEKKRVHVLPYTDNLEQVFQRTDLAICSAGSTCWQLAAIGIPFITFQIAGNQGLIFDYIGAKNIGIPLRIKDIYDGTLVEHMETLDMGRRRTLSRNSRMHVDCDGSRRIARALIGVY